MKASRNQKIRQGAFTRTTWLVIAAVVLLLGAGSFAVVGNRPSSKQSSVKKAETQLNALKVALESYFGDHGHYPKVGNQDYRLGNIEASAILYQTLTGDGNDLIGGLDASDGDLTNDGDAENYFFFFPQEGKTTDSNFVEESKLTFYFVDAFGNPFQYRDGEGSEAINATYDLWSWGETKGNKVPTSSDRGSAKLIANWE